MVPTVHVTTQGPPLKSARVRMDIIAAYQEVGTYRGAADICGTTHKTVRRVIERAEAGDAAVRVREERPRNYDAVAELATARAMASKGRMSAKRLLPIIRAAGYEGSARNFRRLVSAEKALWRRDHHRGRRPALWSPGEYLVIDWATVGGGLHLFCAVLAWSRWRFVAFATDEKCPRRGGSTRQVPLTQIRGLGALWDGVVNVRMPSDVGKWSCRRLPLATPEGHRFDVICCCVVSGCVSPSWVPSGADRAG